MLLNTLLPVEQCTFTTSLSLQAVKSRLNGGILYSTDYYATDGQIDFEGQLSGDAFEMRRIIIGTNAYIPVVTGAFTGSTGHTLISVKIEMPAPLRIFMAVWFGGVGLVCLSIIAAGCIHFHQVFHGGLSLVLTAPFIIFLAASLVYTTLFRRESSKAKIYICALLEAVEV